MLSLALSITFFVGFCLFLGTITVTNNGPAAAKAPVVTDAVPAIVESPQFSVDGGASVPWPGSTTLPDIPAGTKKVITITGKISATATGSLNNSATVKTPTPNKTGDPNNTTTGTTEPNDPNKPGTIGSGQNPKVGDTADVSTTKTADKTDYKPGDTITYTITVTNNGPAAAKAPVVTDAVPAIVESPQYSVDGGAPAA